MNMFVEDVTDFINKEIKRGEFDRYSAETLAFAFLLGLPPAECTGMYVESDWEQEWIDQYDDVVNLIDKCKRTKRKA